ncbi:MAG: LEA type 2 family protein [Sphingomonadales bacterium]|nr:LEA type 2 family protein [Sphingomonadales bacterium]
MKTFLLIALALCLAACKSLEEPLELVSYDGSQIEQFSGQLIKFEAGFHVQNKLWLPVKMKPGSFEIFIDQQKIGNLYLDEPIKLKANKETVLKVPLRMIPEPGFITMAYKAAKKSAVGVKISGYPKVGMLFLYKTAPISKESQIDPALFTPYFPTF